MTLMVIHSSTFITSAANLSQCPESDFPEIAIIGRSNVGKSSLINMITWRNNLAKASATPGKTQLLNYFLIDEFRHLVDLPGYGYAKKSKEQRIQRMDTLQAYLTQRTRLLHTFVLIDGNIPPQDIDLAFIDTISEEGIPFSLIITKIDKTNQKNVQKNAKEILMHIHTHTWSRPDIFFSSSTKNKWKEKILSFIQKLIH